MLTLTPGRGPGKSRPRAGTWTCAYIKNNNKNLLALQTAQPALGDGLAWHSGTSKPHGLVQRAARPGHHRTHADAACSTACILEPPPFPNTRANPANPTILQTEICFVSLFLKEGLLSSLKLCMTR